MDRRTCFLLFILILSPISASEEEHKHHFKAPKAHHRSKTPDIHITIDTPQRPEAPDVAHEQEERQERRCETKTVAATAIITALISAGVILAVHFSTGGCN
jgi:hypothetical protein